MRNAIFLLLVATAAFAGDRLLGVMVVTDGGSVNNASTGYGSAGCSRQTDPGGAGACAQAFWIGPTMLLDIQCQDQGAMVAANKSITDAGDSVKLGVDQFFSTSILKAPVVVSPLPDGGTYVGGVVSIAPVAGNSTARCKVFERTGNE